MPDENLIPINNQKFVPPWGDTNPFISGSMAVKTTTPEMIKPKPEPMVFPIGENLTPKQKMKAQEVTGTIPPMKFEVGEGLTPEQKTKAQIKVTPSIFYTPAQQRAVSIASEVNKPTSELMKEQYGSNILTGIGGFLLDLVDPVTKDLHTAKVATQISEDVAAGRIDPVVYDLMNDLNKTPLQLIGDAAQVGLLAAPAMTGGKLAMQGLKDSLVQLAKFGATEGTLQGLNFGVARALSEGSDNPEQILNTILTTGAGGTVLGAAGGVAFPVAGKVAAEAVSEVIAKVNKLNNELIEHLVAEGWSREQATAMARSGGYAKVPGLSDKTIGEAGQIPESTSRLPTTKSERQNRNMPQQVTPKLGEELPYKNNIPTIDPETQFLNALKESKKSRSLQERIYTQERIKRFSAAEQAGKQTGGGEKGFIAEKSRLKGEMTKVQFQALRTRITQEAQDELFRKIQNSPNLRNFIDTLPAQQALQNLLNGTKLPTEGQIKLLEKVFKSETINALTNEFSTFQTFSEQGLKVANSFRSIMASTDFSFGLRQGIFAAPSFPKEFVASFKEQFKWFASEEGYNAGMKAVSETPNFDLAKGRVAFTNLGEKMGQREERFATSFAEEIPGLGRIIKASERAYTGFANKFRMDIFNSLITDAENLGLNPRTNMKLVDDIASFVNNATGRGSLGKRGEALAPVLNAFLFSPRLAVSRFNLILNPVYYAKLDPFVRKQALKSLFTYAGTITTVLGAAKLAGLDVETDPRNTDFAKIKIGNTRLDIMGGFQQYIRAAAQLITQQTISSTGTGIVTRLGEKLPNYQAPGALSPATRFVEAKEAPIISFAVDLWHLAHGQPDNLGKPISLPNEIYQRTVPLVVQDIIDIAKDNPKLIPLGALGVFGTGLQTYTPNVKIKGQAQPWNESTAIIQYNRDTENEVKRYKQRIDKFTSQFDSEGQQKSQEQINKDDISARKMQEEMFRFQDERAKRIMAR